MSTRFVVVMLALSMMLSAPAAASFHAWEVSEVYSNANGTVQYVVFHTTFDDQHFVGGHTISATSGGTTQSFIVPGNLPDRFTSDEFFIVATPGFEDLPGAIEPDYVMPCGPFFTPGATSITVEIVGASPRTFAGSLVPVDGTQSLHFGAGGPTASAATPTNYDGETGTLALSACQISGACGACLDANFCNGAERCVGTSCAAGPDPCPGDMCDEGADVCFECVDVGDCNDTNDCTTDACETDRTCSHTDNTLACDDGLFCTMTDACASGSCMGTGDPCAAGPGMCLEGADDCGTCASDVDCDNDLFCDGEETCNGDNACVPGSAPCDVEDCDETGDRCRACGDGVIDPGEGCDDDDLDAGDGCDGTCAVEVGFSCGGEPSICTLIPDAGGVDAGGVDAGARDAGARLDGGMDAGDELVPGGGGCTCRASSTRTPSAMWLAIVAAVCFVRRRRRDP